MRNKYCMGHGSVCVSLCVCVYLRLFFYYSIFSKLKWFSLYYENNERILMLINSYVWFCFWSLSNALCWDCGKLTIPFSTISILVDLWNSNRRRAVRRPCVQVIWSTYSRIELHTAFTTFLPRWQVLIIAMLRSNRVNTWNSQTRFHQIFIFCLDARVPFELNQELPAIETGVNPLKLIKTIPFSPCAMCKLQSNEYLYPNNIYNAPYLGDWYSLAR